MLRDHWREFAREIQSYDEIPESHLQVMTPILPSLDQVLHMYIIPQQRGFWEWFNDAPPRNSLFVLSRKEVIVAKETRSGIDVQRCELKDLITFEVGTILLNSWIKLIAANTHALHRINLEYSTVFERDFRHSILWLRTLCDQAQDTPRHAWKMPGEEHIRALPLKFNNAARNYWLQGESALGTCFIKPLTIPMPLYRRMQRTYAAATALVVSTYELCVIAEQGLSYSGRWGQTWHFCSLKQISGLEIIDQKPFPKLQVSLTRAPWQEGEEGTASSPIQEALDIPFDSAQRAEIENIIRTVKELQKAALSTTLSDVAGSVA